MQKLTENRTALAKFKSQNGFGIATANSEPSDHLRITQFKKDLRNRQEWIISELSNIYGEKKALEIFERFNYAIENGNNITVSIIKKCEINGSILNEIVKRYETKNASLLKR